MRCLRLHIEYDGTDFVGWQIQNNGRSVQGEITRVLEQILQEPITLIGAGRTDSGVHARGQIASVRLESALECSSILTALNGVLPDDVCVHSVEDVAEEFHARYDARERCYTYTISLSPTALNRRYRQHVRYPLDVEIMKTAAALLSGEHDFRSFCSHSGEVENTVCNVRLSCWHTGAGVLRYEVRADRFVHGMVRAMVGTMVDIGRGYTPLSDLPAILSSRDRRKAGMAAPARGLVLEGVVY